jgi:hypothetical protein
MSSKTNKKLDFVRLQALADELAEYGNQDLTNLMRRWEQEEGAKIDNNPAPAGGGRCRLAGVTATSTSGQQGAVRNWGQAARRAIRKGGA